MNLETEIVIPHPRPEVFRAYRDDLASIAAHLPNVRTVSAVDRTTHGNLVELVNEWVGNSVVPETISHILAPDMITWTDHASWDEDSWTCKWRIHHHAFGGAVECFGANRFVALTRGRTRLETHGELNLDLAKIDSVPRAVARTLDRAIEHFIVGTLSANLSSIGVGLSRYLDEQASSRGVPAR